MKHKLVPDIQHRYRRGRWRHGRYYTPTSFLMSAILFFYFAVRLHFAGDSSLVFMVAPSGQPIRLQQFSFPALMLALISLGIWLLTKNRPRK